MESVYEWLLIFPVELLNDQESVHSYTVTSPNHGLPGCFNVSVLLVGQDADIVGVFPPPDRLEVESRDCRQTMRQGTKVGRNHEAQYSADSGQPAPA